MTKRARVAGMSLIVPALIVLVWWLLAADSTSPFYPPLPTILTSFQETWVFAHVASDVVPSLTRLALGYALAIFLGVSLGVLLAGCASWPWRSGRRCSSPAQSPPPVWCR